MKANFSVDPDFPVIDGVGHSDKIGFFNVKGGGATNTTFLDPVEPGLHCFYVANPGAAVSTSLASTLVSPTHVEDNSGVWHVENPLCLNSPYVGDNFCSRGSDRVVMSRIQVSGSIIRFAGTDDEDFAALPVAPKCFVALVLDTQCNGAVPPTVPFGTNDNVRNMPFDFGNAINAAATAHLSHVPTCGFGSYPRFRVLASEVIDFAFNPETKYDWVDSPETWTSAGVPPDVTSTVLTRTRYSFWREVVCGFRFDVDLNDCLCSFSGNSPDVTSIVDNSLHVFALQFDGISQNGFLTHPFNALSITYLSQLWFRDFLVPKIPHAPAGADGGVVPDDEVPLAILADQSAALAGDGTFVDRPVKRTKAAHGFYNFAPRGGDAMLFEDDPEFARLQAPGANRGPTRKSDSRARVYPIAARRWKAHKYDDNEDYNAREGDRGGKRGKY